MLPEVESFVAMPWPVSPDRSRDAAACLTRPPEATVQVASAPQSPTAPITAPPVVEAAAVGPADALVSVLKLPDPAAEVSSDPVPLEVSRPTHSITDAPSALAWPVTVAVAVQVTVQVPEAVIGADQQVIVIECVEVNDASAILVIVPSVAVPDTDGVPGVVVVPVSS